MKTHTKIISEAKAKSIVAMLGGRDEGEQSLCYVQSGIPATGRRAFAHSEGPSARSQKSREHARHLLIYRRALRGEEPDNSSPDSCGLGDLLILRKGKGLRQNQIRSTHGRRPHAEGVFQELSRPEHAPGHIKKEIAG